MSSERVRQGRYVNMNMMSVVDMYPFLTMVLSRLGCLSPCRLSVGSDSSREEEGGERGGYPATGSLRRCLLAAAAAAAAAAAYY